MIISISKGQQITIPSKIRKRLHLDSGTRVEIVEERGRVVLKPIDEDLESLFREAKNTKPKLKLNVKQMDKMVEDEIYR